MAFPISLVGESQAGGVITGPGMPTWTVLGKPMSLLNDDVAGHGTGSHAGPKMVEGSGWFTINGVPVVRTGNKASCGHEANGNPWMTLPF
jgi:uncharacterized Zn-binding protein involved in type VI secretion